MEQLFIALTAAVDGTPSIALAAALAWGVLSILLSPCHLASIPLIVGFIGNQREMTRKKAFWTASLFALGILVTIALIGIVTAGLGRMMGDIGGYGNYLVALVFFVVGLHLLGLIPMPFSGPGSIPTQKKGFFAAFLLGLIFGVALGPCTFAFMAPVLGTTFRVAATAPIYAAGLLLAYGIGHCSVIVAAGSSTEMVQRYLQWNEESRGMKLVKQACGLLVILGGVYLLVGAR
ncbi:MAG TPA: cytochrome C biogenesis protein [Cyanobacteria bacterium UBA8530]|nr:cytochrome C biogenesis protein [Cyanobacteria bacterium UBA8530]